MDYAALKIEIALPAYNGMSDAAIATALNAKTVQIFVDVSRDQVLDYLVFTTQEWGMIEHYGKTAPTGTKFSTGQAGTFSASDTRTAAIMGFIKAITVREMIPTSDTTARTNLGSILQNLVDYGFMAAATRTALNAMAQKMVSRADQLGLGAVAPGDVATARTY